MKVAIDYVFSKNKKIGSKVISFGTKFLQKDKSLITPSHVAILVNNRWVIEAVVNGGFRVIPYSKWLEINQELYKIAIHSDYTFDKIKAKFKALIGKKYDYAGVLYFAYRILLFVLFKLPIPKFNKLDRGNRYFCTEVVAEFTNNHNSMISPIQLLEKNKPGKS